MEAARCGDGLFSSSVHIQQTKSDLQSAAVLDEGLTWQESRRMDGIERLYASQVPLASATETYLRHSGWAAMRRKVAAAMLASSTPNARMHRFVNCGSGCTAEVRDDGGEARLRAHYCGDRFCIPCATARANTISRNLAEWMTNQPVRFITLTLAPQEGGLRAHIDVLLRSFAKLRAQTLWRSSVDGGAYSIEITRGARGTHWHVHMHIVAVGSYIDQAELKECWRLASNGSHIVDIRAMSDRDRGARYLAKYVSKGWDKHILRSIDLLSECLLALRGRRLIATFGDWRGRKIERPRRSKDGWKVVDRLDSIVIRARAGEPSAIAILRLLGFSPGRSADRPVRPRDG